MQPTTRLSFSQRHPFIFGFLLIMVAVALFTGATATFRHLTDAGSFGGPRIGIVRIEGMIGDVRKTLEWMRKLAEDRTVRGVLVRVDSPGGAVAPSQELHDAVKRLAADKPVVVSMGSLAASGGLMVSTGATRIVANPATITGSIGVKMEMPNVQGLMDKLGVARQTLVSGDLKDAGSPFRAMSEAERAYFQSIIMEMYGQFVNMIAEDRNIPVEKVRSFADGRILTGSQALELGLVDKLGSEAAAMDVLLALVDLKGEKPVFIEPPKERSWVREVLESALGIAPPQNMGQPAFLYY
ncbi:MAG TPA: signal peptide peptidase SppA [Desulfovibrio sp.]|uniref:signal peptide peptidase SppA n=1 Tax=Nitratidesulfovibrio vulgaris TaxID=881 RepID=UPI000E91ED8B|nr:signal peptide peptidase SppA [Nitratidesulfovibrio vulgaris]WCB46542.1 signal peptide peptidase SppA [Nitratidesulfovibrio vulgaris]HBW15158.1 signal peptide peptidase SppA [Desulfovibrio sp.]